MTVGSPSHIILFLVTAAFTVLSCLAIAKMPRKWQDVMIVASVVICCRAIFYRFAMGLSWEGGIDLSSLLIQQLQVCNFNFTLLLLMLIPRFKLARQYSFYFSMFAASTTLIALNSRWGGAPWYAPTVFNSWLYHSFAIICPLWMFASGRLKPERKYILPVSGCVFGYFTLVYIISEILKSVGIMSESQSFSYIYNTDGIPLLDTFHKWINVPYFHLYPAFVIVVVFFYLLSIPFNRSVSFETTVGGGKLRKRYGVIGGEVTLPQGGFIREGYVLIGWSHDPESEIVQYAPGSKITVGKNNIVLYAVWQRLEQEESSPHEKEEMLSATNIE